MIHYPLLDLFRFQSEVVRSGRRMQKVIMHRSLAQLGSVNIFFRDTEAAGPPILCLHGRWGRGETWIDFIQHYGNRFRVIAPDLRGHGLSSKPISKYTAEEMSVDVVNLLQSLHIESAIIVGHSMGGHVAGYTAAFHPTYAKAIAILDQSAAGPTKPNELPVGAIQPIDPITQEWPLPFSSLREAQECIRANTQSDLGYDYFMNSLVETVEGYQMMFSPSAIAANIAYYQDWFDLLPKMKCPVLLVKAKGGDAINDDDFARMKSLIPNCMAHEIPNPGHCVYLTDRAEFYRIFDQFLDDVLAVHHPKY